MTDRSTFPSLPSDLDPLEDVVFGWSCGGIGRSEVTLMEDADLVMLEGTDDAMRESSVMEEDKVFLLPIVGIYKLSWHGTT